MDAWVTDTNGAEIFSIEELFWILWIILRVINHVNICTDEAKAGGLNAEVIALQAVANCIITVYFGIAFSQFKKSQFHFRMSLMKQWELLILLTLNT